MMKKVTLFLAGMSFAFASAVNANTMINEFSNGSVNLKNGETLDGYVAPLADFSKSSVLYKSSENDAPLSIRHQNIKKVEKNGTVFITQNIRFNGKLIPAYLEEKENGYFGLYQAHFYAPMKRGKNNSTTELQTAWVIYSPIKGFVVLGKNVKASDLNEALIHPKNTNLLSPQMVEENQLLELIRNLNKSI